MSNLNKNKTGRIPPFLLQLQPQVFWEYLSYFLEAEICHCLKGNSQSEWMEQICEEQFRLH